MLMAALCFGLALGAGKRNQVLTLVLAFAFLAISAALVVTVTRATLASLALACSAVLWMRANWPIRLFGGLLVIVLFVAGSYWFRQQRGTGWYEASDASSQYRQLMWKDGLRLARQHPWFGVGMDSIYRHWQEWNIQAYQRFPNLRSHFHSTYVQLAAECGLPVLAVWIWILAAYLGFLWRTLKQNFAHDFFSTGLALGLFTATIAFIAVGVVHYSVGDAEVMILFWFLVGLGTWLGIAASNQRVTAAGTR
jgi:O-antigen ligase